MDWVYLLALAALGLLAVGFIWACDAGSPVKDAS